jgi:hypothetical protein
MIIMSFGAEFSKATICGNDSNNIRTCAITESTTVFAFGLEVMGCQVLHVKA